MKYQWTEEHPTCKELSETLGCTVKGITRGGIVVGQVDGEPVLQEGIEVELEGETPEILAELDLLLPFHREGGKDFQEAVKGCVDLSGTQKAAFKLSQLYGLTQAQLENYIDNNVTNLANAKEFLKKLSAVVLYLVKQAKLDE